MQKTATKITDFIDSLPAESREDIRELHQRISKALPDASQVMWEGKFWGGTDQRIIGYGDMTYVGSNKKEGEWFKLGLAQQKNYITLYVMFVENGKYLSDEYKDKLGKAKVGKSAITFKSLKDIDIEVLMEMIKRGYKMTYNPKK